jgi:cell division ATPase FtsA
MSTKRAKLNLDFGHGGISMNFAMANDFQPRYGEEGDWRVGIISLNGEEFEGFPGMSQNRIADGCIKAVAASINRIISEWQIETGYDFDSSVEITISAAFFDVLFFPYKIEFSEYREITENDIKKIEICKLPENMFQIPLPDEKITSLTSPYFTISDEVKVLEPIGRKAKKLGFSSYFITKHPILSKLLDAMKEYEERIRVSLSCESEFKALANKEEKSNKTALIHITDSMSEFSVWQNSELKYLNKKEIGFMKLKEIIWRLCLCYHKKPKLSEQDFEFVKKNDYIQRFYNMVRDAEISEDSKEFLSADDCLDLLEFVSCILENDTEDSVKYKRFELPGKNKSRTNLTISSYVLSYFAREAIRSLLLGIRQAMFDDDFCKPEFIILECSLPLKGIEELTEEVFGVSARKGYVKWDGETRRDLSASGVGILQSLISGENKNGNVENRKKTTKILSLFGNIFSKVS